MSKIARVEMVVAMAFRKSDQRINSYILFCDITEPGLAEGQLFGRD